MTADQLHESSVISTITKHDIDDKSKADGLTKAFALVQCSWLLIQLIARAVQGLAITELELSTGAFVLCAFIMYLLWWEKPFDMERRIVVTGNTPCGQPACEPIDRVGEWDLLDIDEGIYIQAFKDTGFTNFKYFSDILDSIFVGGVGAAFSAVHLVAWNWDFPSPLIRILWRAFALTAVVTSISLCLFLLLTKTDQPFIQGVVGLGGGGCVLLYCASRLAILVLTLYCFSSMPASVYDQVDWVGFLPHFS